MRAVAGGLAAAVLAGCATREAPPLAESPWARQSGTPGAGAKWSHHPLPGKPATQFSYVRKDGRDAIAVRSEASASLLRYPVRIPAAELGLLQFSWLVPALMEQADLGRRDRADAAVRVILAFDGDRKRFTARDAALSELVRTLTGDAMPYATMMYVWSRQRPVGAVIRNPRTDRIRKLVVESGTARLNQWLDYERDVRADYERVFGEKPGALVGFAIMTDSDNTRSRALAWYGPLRHLPPAAGGR